MPSHVQLVVGRIQNNFINNSDTESLQMVLYKLIIIIIIRMT